jgi:hypothetical protein
MICNRELMKYTEIIDDVIHKMNSSNKIIYVYGGVTNKNIYDTWTEKLTIYSWDKPEHKNVIITIIIMNHIPIEKYKVQISYLDFYFINKLKEIFGFTCLNDRLTEITSNYDNIKQGETYCFYLFTKHSEYNLKI